MKICSCPTLGCLYSYTLAWRLKEITLANTNFLTSWAQFTHTWVHECCSSQAPNSLAFTHPHLESGSRPAYEAPDIWFMLSALLNRSEARTTQQRNTAIRFSSCSGSFTEGWPDCVTLYRQKWPFQYNRVKELQHMSCAYSAASILHGTLWSWMFVPRPLRLKMSAKDREVKQKGGSERERVVTPPSNLDRVACALLLLILASSTWPS